MKRMSAFEGLFVYAFVVVAGRYCLYNVGKDHYIQKYSLNNLIFIQKLITIVLMYT